MDVNEKKATKQDFVRMGENNVESANCCDSKNRKMPKAQTFNRMLGEGVDHTDYSKIVKRVINGEDYVTVCEELGDQSYAYAEDELKKNHKHTAKIFFMKAAALYRVGPYETIAYTEEKTRMYEKELKSYSRGIVLYENIKAEKVEISYKNSKMTGWMYIPKLALADVPVILTIGGLTGFKEELHSVAMMLVERGFAVLNVDGPGQGESFYVNHCYFDVENEAAYEAILDYILNRNDVGNKIGLYGLCFGGYLAARMAGYSPNKVLACVCVGGSYEGAECVNFNPNFLDAFAMRCGTKAVDDQSAKNLLAQFTLTGIAEKITSPLLIIHNDPDPIISIKNIEKLYNEAPSSDKTYKIYPGPDHCAHNDKTEVNTFASDWLADRILG